MEDLTHQKKTAEDKISSLDKYAVELGKLSQAGAALEDAHASATVELLVHRIAKSGASSRKNCWSRRYAEQISGELFILVQRIWGKLPANFSANFDGHSRPKFTSRIVGIPLQFHFLEPKIYSRRFSAYGGDQELPGRGKWCLIKKSTEVGLPRLQCAFQVRGRCSFHLRLGLLCLRLVLLLAEDWLGLFYLWLKFGLVFLACGGKSVWSFLLTVTLSEDRIWSSLLTVLRAACLQFNREVGQVKLD